jgi:oxygen-independent coproporphyrinogen-3 oxidase
MSGIYIHIPFCKQACYYCDFHFSTSLRRKEEMLKAIVIELELRKNELAPIVETIYFGGGTPSLLSIDEIQMLLDVIYKNYCVIEKPEITLEANPDDLNDLKINQLANSPINRLSIGIQSFFDDDLKFMNRAHSAKEAIESLQLATQLFENITMDLIYGIPKMSNEKWFQNLQIAFDMGVPHISSYALTVEDNTALSNFIKKGKYPPVKEELAHEHFQILIEQTMKYNFIAYEISNFGKKGYFSKHNISYWQGKHYMGIGPSAHSFNGINRSWNVSNNAKYIKSVFEGVLPNQVEKLSKKNRFNEAIMTGLRTIWGVSLERIEKDFGLDYKNTLVKNARKHFDNKTIKIVHNTLLITDSGKFLVDGISADLFLV